MKKLTKEILLKHYGKLLSIAEEEGLSEYADTPLAIAEEAHKCFLSTCSKTVRAIAGMVTLQAHAMELIEHTPSGECFVYYYGDGIKIDVPRRRVWIKYRDYDDFLRIVPPKVITESIPSNMMLWAPNKHLRMVINIQVVTDGIAEFIRNKMKEDEDDSLYLRFWRVATRYGITIEPERSR